jgi:uncharacterized protein
MLLPIPHRIAQELSITTFQATAAIELLDSGSTVPFIARYRKEATQGLDDTQLRNLEERLSYLREMEERRQAILKSITEQNKLTPELEAAILAAETKIRLEDLYLPYKQKRRTKGQIAIEAGLEPLADALLQDHALVPENEAATYINTEKGIEDVKAALEGARYILMERFAEDAELIGRCRSYLEEHSILISKVIEEKKTEAQKFQNYFDHQELWKKIPSHRALAMFRGRKEGFLQLSLMLPEMIENPDATPVPQQMIAEFFQLLPTGKAADTWLSEVVRWTWRIKIHTHLETELLSILKENAEQDALVVFKNNLHDLLMSAPAGARVTMGLDPGFRTGVKAAIVDATGKLVTFETIYPHEPQKKWNESIAKLKQLIVQHQVELISIGNGTASRETEKCVEECMQTLSDQKITKIVTSEAGASVYSASELGAKEFPDLDVSIRGAVSIARRVQDPLAELVKIDPKAIGVGQYQHDVNQVKLARSLDAVVEDAVNAVGVDVNTASAPLLTRIAGLNQQLANNVITYREQHGAFASRQELKKVPRLGEKTFEQCAGFLRISGGANPLDASSVHPEAYPIVETILTNAHRTLPDVIGNKDFLKSVDPKSLVNDQFGLFTIEDILKELEKPGRDPRSTFTTAQFKEGVNTLNDLKEGMILEGVITNVANFGAFVDIGVHQDGLVHISEISQQFVKDPREIVKTGQIVKVKVLEVDVPRKRISLSLRIGEKTAPKQDSFKRESLPNKVKKPQQPKNIEKGALGLALEAAFKNKN